MSRPFQQQLGVLLGSHYYIITDINTRTAELILVTRTAKGGLVGAPPPPMIFDIVQVL